VTPLHEQLTAILPDEIARGRLTDRVPSMLTLARIDKAIGSQSFKLLWRDLRRTRLYCTVCYADRR
jgi:hypothetical protein